MLYRWSFNNFGSSLILQFFICYETKPFQVWSLLPCKTELLSKSFVLQFIKVFRSSYRICTVKNVIENMRNFTRKHLCFLTKLQAWGPVTLLIKTPTQVFLVKLSKILRTTILKKICEQLFLCMSSPLLVQGKPMLDGKRHNWATNTFYCIYNHVWTSWS